MQEVSHLRIWKEIIVGKGKRKSKDLKWGRNSMHWRARKKAEWRGEQREQEGNYHDEMLFNDFQEFNMTTKMGSYFAAPLAPNSYSSLTAQNVNSDISHQGMVRPILPKAWTSLLPYNLVKIQIQCLSWCILYEIRFSWKYTLCSLQPKIPPFLLPQTYISSGQNSK